MFKPKYQITPEILTAVSQIAEIKSLIEHSRVLPLNEAQLRRQAISRMAHTSTSIEGNKLAQYQVDRVLSGMSVNADERSIKEVKNYQEALKQVEDMASQKIPLTIEKILHLHSVLMKDLLPKEKIGHFRPGPIYIVDDLGDGRENVRFEGPPADRVAFFVNELLHWLENSSKEKIHPVIKAAIFHIHFVTIHPFSDGNGRITRLLTIFLLYKDLWDFKKIIVLEDFYNQDRQEYYNALNEVQGAEFHQGEDLTPWIDYFVLGFLVEARKVADQIKSIGFANKENEQIMLDKDQIKIMDFLSTSGRITSSDIEDLLGIAKRTAQLKLKTLVDNKLIISQGKGPSTYYIIAQ